MKYYMYRWVNITDNIWVNIYYYVVYQMRKAALLRENYGKNMIILLLLYNIQLIGYNQQQSSMSLSNVYGRFFLFGE